MDREPKIHTKADVLKAISVQGFEAELGEENSPIEINLEGFDAKTPKLTELTQKRVKDFTKIAQDYIAGSLIKDSLGAEHEERREWRHTMYSKYGPVFSELYDTNKLRLNNIAGVKGHLEVLASGLELFEVNSTKSEGIKALVRAFPEFDDYNALSLDERLKVVEQVDSICRSFLKIVSEKGE